MIASIVWDVDPILFKVGSWEVRWYGLMWGLGLILAYEMVCPLLKKDAMTKFKLSVTPEVNATFSGFALNKVAIFSRAS